MFETLGDKIRATFKLGVFNSTTYADAYDVLVMNAGRHSANYRKKSVGACLRRYIDGYGNEGAFVSSRPSAIPGQGRYVSARIDLSLDNDADRPVSLRIESEADARYLMSVGQAYLNEMARDS